MKRVVLLSFFGLVVILAGCNKGKADFVLTGVITDDTFNAPLENAVVKLYATEVGGLNTDLIGTATSGSDGSYSFTFPRDKIETYHLSVVKENYFSIYKDISFSSLTISEDNVRNYSTTAVGWVKFHVTNLNPNTSDVLEFIRQEGKVDCEECCPGGYRYFYGAVDSTFYCANDGNLVYSGYYWVQGGGGQGPVWVITPPFDTVEINLSY